MLTPGVFLFAASTPPAYLSAFSGKGEECIPQTWDMYHEKYVLVLLLFPSTNPVQGGVLWSFSGTLPVSPSCVAIEYALCRKLMCE